MIIDARENRNVAISDVVGAYLLVMMDDYVLVKVAGIVVETLCDINSEYEQYVTMENGKQVLYLRFKKSLYGCMQSDIVWCNTFKGCLIDMSLKLNK